jgi:hypothetical protein
MRRNEVVFLNCRPRECGNIFHIKNKIDEKNMKTNEKRIALLKQVLKAESGFQFSIKELSHYNWDYDGSPALLDKATIKDILSRYAAGKLSQEAVYEWADFIELRDDIDYLENEEDMVADILHELANPDTEGELTMDRARFFLNQL